MAGAQRAEEHDDGNHDERDDQQRRNGEHIVNTRYQLPDQAQAQDERDDGCRYQDDMTVADAGL